MGWNRLRRAETNTFQLGVGWSSNEHHQSNAGPRRWAVASEIRSTSADSWYQRNCWDNSWNQPSNFSGSPAYKDGSLILGRNPGRAYTGSVGSGLAREEAADAAEDRWRAT